jgi:DNA-binding protein H-NS
MAAVNYEKMSLKELHDHEARLRSALAKVKDRQKAELKAKMEALASNQGMTVAELFGIGRGRGGKGGKVAIKYRNPDNPGDTWTGRGRQPRWLVAILKKGGKLDDFKI